MRINVKDAKRFLKLPSPSGGISANSLCSSPFKGEVRRGMGPESAEFSPIPTPTLPLKGREKPSAAVTGSSPFKGEVRRGMGSESAEFSPIPTPTLPLKGREMCVGALKLARIPSGGGAGGEGIGRGFHARGAQGHAR
jgi:hypothetical protein